MSETMLAKWNKWAAGVQINDRQMTPDNNEYAVAMAAFYAGYDSHAIEAESAQVIPQPNREALQAAIGGVLFNVMNFPENVQARLLGQNMRSLNDKITDAVSVALSPAPLSIDREALSRAVQGVLWNVSNYPHKAQPYLLGTDNSPLTAKVTDAVMTFLSAQPVAGEVEASGQTERQHDAHFALYAAAERAASHGNVIEAYDCQRYVDEIDAADAEARETQPTPEAPELFPGTRAALDALSIRTEGEAELPPGPRHPRLPANYRPVA